MGHWPLERVQNKGKVTKVMIKTALMKLVLARKNAKAGKKLKKRVLLQKM